MSKKINGSVIFILIFCMYIFSFILGKEFKQLEILQLNNQIELKQLILDTEDNAILNILTHILKTKKMQCLSTLDKSILLKKTIKWWEINACHTPINNKIIFYLTANLQEDQCATIQNTSSKLKVAYQSLFVLIQHTKKYSNYSLYQLNAVQPVHTSQHCNLPLRKILPGVQYILKLYP